jgi:hypothetical protein
MVILGVAPPVDERGVEAVTLVTPVDAESTPLDKVKPVPKVTAANLSVEDSPANLVA